MNTYLKIGLGLAALGLIWRRYKMYNDYETAARVAFGEARGEGPKGQQAVLNVMTNRVNANTWFGDNLHDVATKPYQFSAYNQNDPNRAKIEAVTVRDPIFAEILAMAKLAHAGNLPDITGGADHYHAVGITPNWADPDKITTQIGNHLFYKLEA